MLCGRRTPSATIRAINRRAQIMGMIAVSVTAPHSQLPLQKNRQAQIGSTIIKKGYPTTAKPINTPSGNRTTDHHSSDH